MAKAGEPIVLDLATLPREQLGPFLLLGLDKSADREQIEAHWAERLKWARKGLVKVPLEDVNWAKDVLNEHSRRLRADAASFNADLSDGTLEQLAQRYGTAGGQPRFTWTALDEEKDLANYTPAVELPDLAEVRQGVTLPPMPRDLPAVLMLLERLAAEPLDPWNIELPVDNPHAADGPPS